VGRDYDMSPDELCEQFASTGLRISVRDLEDLVLIEGEPAALEFLGHLLIAQAQFEKDSGFEIGPTGPGCALFTPDSTRGFYIHVRRHQEEG
jgi:hypothetical protein